MQFRAGAVYIVLFLVVAAGAYGVIATAESPEVTIDEADADYQLSLGDDFTVNDRTYNVSELGGGMGTLEHVEEAMTDVEWQGANAAEGDSWDAGDSVQLEEDGEEYYVYIYAPPETDDEDEEDEDAQPETFLLIEAFDEGNFTPVERPDGVYIIQGEGDTQELVHVNEFDDIDSLELEVGDEVTFYETDMEEAVDGEVIELEPDTVTVEYMGEDVTTHSLENRQTVLIDGQEFGVYFPSEDTVYLTEDVESFEAQHAEVEEFGERIHGLWWVVALSIVTVIMLAGLAFMPSRG